MTTLSGLIQKGGFRKLILLFLPISLVTFSSAMFLFIEKLLLAYLSTQTMEAAVNAAYVCQIFQAPCVALVMMAQVFVGRWLGAQDFKVIGPGIWQFIWFSFLSMLLTVPCSIVYGKYYFQGTGLEEIVRSYFYFLISINFLYPLGATLSCFYLGQGKTRLVLFATLGTQSIKLLLTYLFIFGWGGWIPALGLLGGAVSTLVAQGGFCVLLFWVFIHSKQATIFHSRIWRLQSKLFWECIHPGLLRAINRILNFCAWAAVAHLMVAKGGNYLLVLSIGGTLFFFLPFVGDAICQAQTTVVSQILGARSYHLLDNSFRSGFLLTFLIVALFSIPLILFPSQLFHYLFPTIVLNGVVINEVFLGIWLSFIFYTFCSLPISYILAFKDMRFSLFMGALNWINGFLLMYLAINFFQIAANQFWTVLSLMHATTFLLYFWRMRKLHLQIISPSLIVFSFKENN